MDNEQAEQDGDATAATNKSSPKSQSSHGESKDMVTMTLSTRPNLAHLAHSGGRKSSLEMLSTRRLHVHAEIQNLLGEATAASWIINEDEVSLLCDEPFAHGAAGEVFHVQWHGARAVAKTCDKLLTTANLRDLVTEIKVMSSLRHPNVVGFWGVMFRQSSPWLIMEEVSGGSLVRLCCPRVCTYILRATLPQTQSELTIAMHPNTRVGQPRQEDLLVESTRRRIKVFVADRESLTMDFVSGMRYLSSLNLIHRDLKPSNLLIGGDRRLRIADFGLAAFPKSKNDTSMARQIDAEVPKTKHTLQNLKGFGQSFYGGDSNKSVALQEYDLTGETGSYRYMAPEVFRHERYSSAVDVYSFAVIMYWLNSGVKPFFQFKLPVEAARKAALEHYRPPLGIVINERMRGLVEECWSPEPSKRPTFKEIGRRLADADHFGVPAKRLRWHRAKHRIRWRLAADRVPVT